MRFNNLMMIFIIPVQRRFISA